MDMPVSTSQFWKRCARRLTAFSRDEEGNSTVEMVIGMAGAISLGLAVTDAVTRGVENLANDIRQNLMDVTIVTSFEDDTSEN